MENPRFERDLIYLEREARELLMHLESRRTKSLGREYSMRIQRHLRMAADIMMRIGPPDRRLLHMIRGPMSELGATQPRERGIEALRNVLDFMSSARASISEKRVVELEDQVKKLQAQLADLFTSSEEAPPREIPGKSEVDVSKSDSVFVIMPFSEAFEDVWSGGIVRAAEAEGFDPIRVDMIDRSSNITDDIVDSVKKCRLCIVDVTQNNPNVMFELGYALAESKPHIIISQSAEFLPFDIRQIRTIVYSNTWSGIEELSRRIQDFLREFKKTKPKKTPVGTKKRQ